MDATMLLPAVRAAVTAVAAYLKSEAARKAGDKIVETLGEKTGEGLVNVGGRTLSTMRAWFTKKKDTEAQQALVLTQRDPGNIEHQQKLIDDTLRLAVADPSFAHELKILGDQVTIAQQKDIVQHIDNKASNQGAQGVFNAPISFTSNRSASSDEDK